MQESGCRFIAKQMEMQKTENGQYVRYDDYAKQLDALKKDRDQAYEIAAEKHGKVRQLLEQLQALTKEFEEVAGSKAKNRWDFFEDIGLC
jgi:uncharacterized protein YdbL (DUF1318 family)